jgi:hypothetical protein
MKPLVALWISFPLAAEAGGELQATAAFAFARDPSGQKAAAVADAILGTKVRSTPTLRWIEPARVLSGDPRTREEETLERARAALADGRRTYDAMALDQAIARLGQAISLYQETGPLLGDLDELETALAHMGAALVLRGSADEAESTFVELLTISPNHQLEGFPPTVTTVFERASEKAEKLPTGSVEMFSTPPYAAVYLDGRFEGITPVTLSDLSAGTHYFRIEKLGYTLHGGPIEVSPNQTITSQTRLNGIKRGAELRDLTARCAEEVTADGMGGALRQLSRDLIADTLIFVSVTQSGSDATFVGGVFDAATGSRLSTERAVLSADSPAFVKGLDEYIARLVGTASGKPPSSASVEVGSGSAFGLGGGQAPPPPKMVGEDLTTSPPEEGANIQVILGWTLVGVGAAAVIVGAVFAGLSKATYDDFRLTQQTSPDLPELMDDGKTKALVADLCYLGGALLAVGGGTILLVELYREPTPDQILSGGPIDGAGLTLSGAF